jgi:hypothetical protein
VKGRKIRTIEPSPHTGYFIPGKNAVPRFARVVRGQSGGWIDINQIPSNGPSKHGSDRLPSFFGFSLETGICGYIEQFPDLAASKAFRRQVHGICTLIFRCLEAKLISRICCSSPSHASLISAAASFSMGFKNLVSSSSAMHSARTGPSSLSNAQCGR